MNELALFAGAGGGILGGILCGFRTVCAVEIEASARGMLIARQDDGCTEPYPIWDDVRTFDGKPWRGVVDIVTGGFPCQDISAAGKGAGLDGERSGLWSEMSRIIGEVRPRYALVENSPVLTSRGLGVVLGDLAAMGYDARWGVLSAADAIWLAGTPSIDHLRERIWIVATDALRPEWGANDRPCGASGEELLSQGKEGAARSASSRETAPNPPRNEQGRQEQRAEWERTRAGGESNGYSHRARLEKQWRAIADETQLQAAERGSWWESEPAVGRVAHGVASRVDRLRALGNGQVPAVVALAWRLLSQMNTLLDRP